MRKVDLPSGAVLTITPAPFAEAKALYQALLIEFKSVKMDAGDPVAFMIKDFLCLGFSSPKVESCLWKCMERCLYQDLKMDMNTFEPVERRVDYLKVLAEVVKENVTPFLKSLYAEYQTAMAVIDNIQA